jgi:hypothetical protein
MREIKRERLIEDSDILLFDILQELNNLKEIIDSMDKTYQKIQCGDKEIAITKLEKKFKCKYCGGEHEKAWQIAQCGKTQKKG